MASRVLLCVSVCVLFLCVEAQVGSLCRPNERLLACGCPKTCKDPAPNCAGVCQMGCFCEEGQVRNETSHCVKLSDCPPILSAYKQDTSEPRINDGNCPPNEEYRFCEPCNRTCENPNPVCPAQCSRGCFCKGDLLRDSDGRCVKNHQCSNFLAYVKEKEKNFIEPIPYRFSCGRNQVYKECVRCTRTCSDPHEVCSSKCKTGCFCQDGLVKGPDGKCVKPEECPKAEVLFGGSSASMEECSSGEDYFSCGWCEPSCRDPSPQCPAVCTRGCLCRPPLLRHSSGQCVPQEQCHTVKCLGQNEEYVCRYGCEPKCDAKPCPYRPRRCKLGCTCKFGFLRDSSGECVPENQCGLKQPIVVV